MTSCRWLFINIPALSWYGSPSLFPDYMNVYLLYAVILYHILSICFHLFPESPVSILFYSRFLLGQPRSCSTFSHPLSASFSSGIIQLYPLDNSLTARCVCCWVLSLYIIWVFLSPFLLCFTTFFEQMFVRTAIFPLYFSCYDFRHYRSFLFVLSTDSLHCIYVCPFSRVA